MIRIAIVDDEENFANNLKQDILKHFEKQQIQCQVSVYTDPTELIHFHRDHAFDLIFLDIDMPKKSGMELASEIRETGYEVYLIFISNYSSYVFEAFQYSAFRFIRKERSNIELPEAINAFCYEINVFKKCVKLNTENKKSVLQEVNNIIYFFSIRHDIFYFNSNGETIKLLVRNYTMDELEKSFNDYGFLRIHKSYLVNYRYVYQFRENNLLLNIKKSDTDHILPVSYKRLSKVKKKFKILIRNGDDI